MRPGLKRLIAGILLLLMAGIYPVVTLIQDISSLQSAPQKRFEIPGSIEFHAHEPGRYYLWQHLNTEYEGANYAHDVELPESLVIEVRDAEGRELYFIRNRSTSIHGPSEAKQSVGYVQLAEPTTLDIKVSGEVPPTVFSVSSFRIFGILKSFTLSIAAALLMGALGIGLLTWGIIRLCIGAKQKAGPPPVPVDS